jgi:hypothetical protein
VHLFFPFACSRDLLNFSGVCVRVCPCVFVSLWLNKKGNSALAGRKRWDGLETRNHSRMQRMCNHGSSIKEHINIKKSFSKLASSLMQRVGKSWKFCIMACFVILVRVVSIMENTCIEGGNEPTPHPPIPPLFTHSSPTTSPTLAFWDRTQKKTGRLALASLGAHVVRPSSNSISPFTFVFTKLLLKNLCHMRQMMYTVQSVLFFWYLHCHYKCILYLFLIYITFFKMLLMLA